MATQAAFLVTTDERNELLNLARQNDVELLNARLNMITQREGVHIAVLIPYVKNDEQITLLHAASETSAMDAIEYLLNHQAWQTYPGHKALLTSAINGMGENAPMWAVRHKQVPALLELYSKGLALNLINQYGFTIIMIAAATNDTNTLNTTLSLMDEHEATRSLIHRPKVDGEQPLHLVVRKGNLDGAKALITYGANLGARSASGSTALHVAAICRDADLASLLLSNGADPLVRNGAQDSPWTIALRNLMSHNGSGGIILAIVQWRMARWTRVRVGNVVVTVVPT